ncbi:MAG: flagellin [Alphaproteobacteria bacterium]|nr:flagellin [Alphaproteobacteria bacterium]
MTLSVNTNKSAMLALQNLTRTNMDLEVTQSRINTGLKVTGAKDNAATYAIAQNMRGDIGALDAVSQSLSRAVSIIDVALAAGEAVSDLLVEMKAKAVAAIDPSLDTAARDALNEDFQALLEQVSTIISNATFDGANLLDGSLTPGIEVLADADAANAITIETETLSVSGSIITLASTASVTTATAASAALGLVGASLDNTNAALARLGSAAKKIETHAIFVGKLQDTLTAGVGNLVDADLATESARLQALQVKQQLGVQALAIANQSPQIILSLFQ